MESVTEFLASMAAKARPGSASPPSAAPHPHRDREKERAQKKAERQARTKAQKHR
jgi:hypothetical protein